MNQTDTKPTLIQVWEDWDEQESTKAAVDSPPLCRIDNPDCESCQ